jgi:hypothetical protein
MNFNNKYFGLTKDTFYKIMSYVTQNHWFKIRLVNKHFLRHINDMIQFFTDTMMLIHSSNSKPKNRNLINLDWNENDQHMNCYPMNHSYSCLYIFFHYSKISKELCLYKITRKIKDMENVIYCIYKYFFDISEEYCLFTHYVKKRIHSTVYLHHTCDVNNRITYTQYMHNDEYFMNYMNKIINDDVNKIF